MTDATPADWYPDPDDAEQLRYWDGEGWTDNYAPRFAEEGAEPVPVDLADLPPPQAKAPPIDLTDLPPPPGADLVDLPAPPNGEAGADLVDLPAPPDEGDPDEGDVADQLTPRTGGADEHPSEVEAAEPGSDETEMAHPGDDVTVVGSLEINEEAPEPPPPPEDFAEVYAAAHEDHQGPADEEISETEIATEPIFPALDFSVDDGDGTTTVVRESEIDDFYGEAPDGEDRQKRTRRLLILAVLVPLILAGGWFFFVRGDDGATTQADDGSTDAVPSPTQPPTTTTTTTPPPTPTVPPATTVVVPDLTGLSASAAEATLAPSGLTLEVSEVETRDATPGTVIRQDPTVGEDVERETVVVVQIAVPPPPECNDIDGPIPTTTFFDVLAIGDEGANLAAAWAQQKGIISSTGAVFNPHAPLSRSVLVTVLWRYHCEPSATIPSSFTDVPDDAFYADAVDWAVEVGVVNAAAEFDPDGRTTRAQWVVVVWRSLGSPEPTSEAVFDDADPNAFYADALSWAVENGLINGISPTNFGTEVVLTRLDAIVLLYQLELRLDPDVT